MRPRSASTTIASFVFRFAALLLLTLAVLSGVAVRASRGDGSAPLQAARPATETAQEINSRRYPLVSPEAAPQR